MFCPHVLSGVEQRNGLTRLRIERTLPVGFAAITVKASESQILNRIFATRQYVIHRKLVILPSLVCMAVLAQVMCALSDTILKGSRYLARH